MAKLVELVWGFTIDGDIMMEGGGGEPFGETLFSIRETLFSIPVSLIGEGERMKTFQFLITFQKHGNIPPMRDTHILKICVSTRMDDFLAIHGYS